MKTKAPIQQPVKTQATARAPQPAHESAPVQVTAQAHPATLIQRARRDPRSLTPQNVRQLHRTLGNRGVGRLLTQPAQQQPAPTQENHSGLPDPLQAGVEARLGISQDDTSLKQESFVTGQDLLSVCELGIHRKPKKIAHESTHVVQRLSYPQQRLQPLPIGIRKRETVIQRKIENETYRDDPVNNEASKKFFSDYNVAVQKAHKFATTVPSLGTYAKLDGHTQEWDKKWKNYLAGIPVPAMAATFGYVIESLVSKPISMFSPSISLSGYSVVSQVTVGGTRPDLVLQLSKGGQHIAWLDVTAEGSIGHIYLKDNWSSHAINFAEVTYPSLDLATLAFMKQNKDNTGKISKKDFQKRKEAANKEYKKRKKAWGQLGKQLTFGKLKKKIGERNEILDLMPEIKQDFIFHKLEKVFLGNGPLDKKLVPSILKAMGVQPAPWGYTTGFSISEKAGEAWLIDNYTSFKGVI